jgi:hypothetical protein
MTAITKISRGILTLIGALALITSLSTMTSGSNIDLTVALGPVLGILALGAAAWTTAPGTLRAVVVWLGVLAVAGAAVILLANAGPMQTRDLLLYVGVPTAIVLVACLVVAMARVRAGALGA